MATGRLGNAVSTNGISTYGSVYQIPTNTYSVFNVSFTNTNTTSVTIRLAISTSSSAPGAAEFIEFDTTIVAKGVFERTGLVAGAGLYVVTSASASAVNVMVYGIETSTS